jgi:hypothetical protein
MRNVPDVAEENTHFMFNNVFFFYESGAGYERVWRDIAEPDRLGN